MVKNLIQTLTKVFPGTQSPVNSLFLNVSLANYSFPVSACFFVRLDLSLNSPYSISPWNISSWFFYPSGITPFHTPQTQHYEGRHGRELKVEATAAGPYSIAKTCLSSFDRIFLGLWSAFLDLHLIKWVALLIQSSTLLKFHQTLVKRKYRLLYSSPNRSKPTHDPFQKSLPGQLHPSRGTFSGGHYPSKHSLAITHSSWSPLRWFSMEQSVRDYYTS